MNKTILSILIVSIWTLMPLTGFAAMTTIEGSIQGYTCVTEGTICPTSKADPLAAVERVFVLQTSSNEFYFLPNVDRASLLNHINGRIRVSGKINRDYKSIQAWRIDALGKKQQSRVWGAPSVEEIAREPWKYF